MVRGPILEKDVILLLFHFPNPTFFERGVESLSLGKEPVKFTLKPTRKKPMRKKSRILVLLFLKNQLFTNKLCHHVSMDSIIVIVGMVCLW